MNLQGRPTDSITHFQTALRVGAEQGKEDRFRNVVTLNLARAFYSAENYPRAIEHYAMVDRDSRQWPEAQFERGWAHFRLQDMNGALGLLHDHSGPFFEEAYFPEAHLLRVHSLFLMCKFPEANLQIDAFQERYKPQLALLRNAALLTPDDFFGQMRAHVEGGSHNLPLMVSWIFEEEDRFLDSLTAVRHAEDEMARLRNISANPFSLAAMKWVRDRRDAIVETEGLRMRGRVGLMEDKLAQMLDDSEMSKLDIMQLETRLYEVASRTGEMPDAKRTVSRKLRVKKGYRHWPFEGEYWGDETGYYRVNARPDCPSSLQTGE
jgi:tetratricopeptide (TPR) repeat protein